MPKSFTEKEREEIRTKLINACKQNWSKQGYKSTSVDLLCKESGISKGAFYIFFESKEALFCEVICQLNNQIYKRICDIYLKNPSKAGMAEALMEVYQMYDNNNFLYDANSADYQLLLTKISEEQRNKMEQSEWNNQKILLEQPFLRYKIDKKLAASVVYSMIMNVKNKQNLPYEHRKVFAFMVDGLIEKIFE